MLWIRRRQTVHPLPVRGEVELEKVEVQSIMSKDEAGRCLVANRKGALLSSTCL
jgi:hypothetical protein